LTDVEFLQWALPRVGLRWAGFRRVRRQVLRRVTHVTISRFFRDRAMFDALERIVLPALGSPVRAWSAACTTSATRRRRADST
jgi:chemotaxis protein methyltransferase CheR